MQVGQNRVVWTHGKTIVEDRKTMEDVETDKTSCKIIDENDEIISEGLTIRNPKDKYCKDKGRRSALSIALITIPKELRPAYWEAYRTMNPGNPRW